MSGRGGCYQCLCEEKYGPLSSKVIDNERESGIRIIRGLGSNNLREEEVIRCRNPDTNTNYNSSRRTCKSTNLRRIGKNSPLTVGLLVISTILIFQALCANIAVTATPVPPIRPSRSVRILGLNSISSSNSNSNSNSIPSLSAALIPSSSNSQSAPVIEPVSSLSIVSPLDILRQNMVMEILRRRQHQNTQRQVQLNKAMLDRIG